MIYLQLNQYFKATFIFKYYFCLKHTNTLIINKVICKNTTSEND